MASALWHQRGLTKVDAGILMPSSASLLIKRLNDVRRAYIHAAEYWLERVKMMQAWADYLDDLREGGKVLPLTRRARKATI